MLDKVRMPVIAELDTCQHVTLSQVVAALVVVIFPLSSSL